MGKRIRMRESGVYIEKEIDRGIEEKALSLPEDPERYFNIDGSTFFVAPAMLVLAHSRPRGIKNAIDYMRQAFLGNISKRDPITVCPLGPDYLVIDGNSTAVVATAAGWTAIACQMVQNNGSAGARIDAL